MSVPPDKGGCKGGFGLEYELNPSLYPAAAGQNLITNSRYLRFLPHDQFIHLSQRVRELDVRQLMGGQHFVSLISS